MNIFVGLAKLLLDAGERHKALGLLNLVMQHPTSYYETKEIARKLLADMGMNQNAVIDEIHPTADWRAVAKEWIEIPANFTGNNLQT